MLRSGFTTTSGALFQIVSAYQPGHLGGPEYRGEPDRLLLNNARISKPQQALGVWLVIRTQNDNLPDQRLQGLGCAVRGATGILEPTPPYGLRRKQRPSMERNRVPLVQQTGMRPDRATNRYRLLVMDLIGIAFP